MTSEWSTFLTLTLYVLLSSVNTGDAWPNFNATAQIEAEDFSWALYAEVYDDCFTRRMSYAGLSDANTVIAYDGTDFSEGVDTFTVRLVNYHQNLSIDVSLHLVNANTQPFLTFPVEYGGGGCEFKVMTLVLDKDNYPSGVQDLSFTFPNAPSGGYLNIDWFTFHQNGNFT